MSWAPPFSLPRPFFSAIDVLRFSAMIGIVNSTLTQSSATFRPSKNLNDSSCTWIFTYVLDSIHLTLPDEVSTSCLTFGFPIFYFLLSIFLFSFTFTFSDFLFLQGASLLHRERIVSSPMVKISRYS